MKILVNYIAASKGGAMSILKEFYEYIKENDKENTWVFLLSDNYIEKTNTIQVKVLKNVKKSWINRLKFDFFYGKKIINEINPDVVFSMQNTCIRRINKKQILYVHQAIPFQKKKKFSFLRKEEFKLAMYQYLIGGIIKKSIKISDKVIVQSEWMKKSIISKKLKENENIFKVEPSIRLEKVPHGKLINTNFFYPAGKAIYKNHECIISACKILNNRGIKNFNVYLTLDNLTNIDGSMENIKFIGSIDRTKVLEKMMNSTLIFPSYLETYGLPLKEARELGTIVLASDCDFSKEVLKNYSNAYFFDPFKPNELAFLMEEVMKNRIVYKKDMVSKEKKNSWKQVIEIINH
ncbi:glycosyltransferase [Clostridium perfringens D]|uniref:glycosyltransferase n=1 Tax=Clostridium perfringens TaxID=1502 RepID=UPI002245FB7B|nr:glycosyltransferase [Clostridium perfringens]MCX0407784.1 glycosyltransferase [Clostridium perfringens]WEV13638.1 glycosyltransferase [Clostridium perfringens D]